MKFSNLRLIQQLAILADLAGILPPEQVKRYTGTYVAPGESEEFDTSKYGLTQSVGFFKLVRMFYCKKNTDDMDRNKLRFMQLEDKADVMLTAALSSNPNYRKELGISRFGLGNDLVIKNVDVKDAILQTTKLLESFEKLLEIDIDVSGSFKSMAKQIPKAELIDEAFLDRLFVNNNIASKLSTLRQNLYFSRKDFDNTPFAMVLTPEELSSLDYVFELGGDKDVKIYHYPSKDNPTANVLSINLGQGGDDMVEIYCGTQEGDKHERIAAFTPDNDTDDKEFTRKIRDAIEAAVLSSDYRDSVINKLTYFLGVLDELEISSTHEMKVT